MQAETALTNSVQGSLVNAATSNIQAAFTNDDGKLKDAALSYAMDALAGKDVDADQVAAMYSKFISDFGSDLAKVNGTEVALSPEATAVIADELEVRSLIALLIGRPYDMFYCRLSSAATALRAGRQPPQPRSS